jgi:hypothetical protein
MSVGRFFSFIGDVAYFILKISNLAAFLTNLYLNYKFGKPAKGDKMDGRSIARLSAAYDHVGLPKGPAFAIWGLIFAWTLVFTISQVFTRMFDGILPTFTPWFCAAQLIQGLWVPIFTASDPDKASSGGDIWLWLANTLLIVPIPFAFLKACEALASDSIETNIVAYWLSYGVTINAAWVLLAAGLTVNLSAVAAGLQGHILCAVAVLVLAATICLELYITGLVGSNVYRSPTAFFSVGVWALFWVFKYLKDMPEGSAEVLCERSADHAKRIMPLYGSTFVAFYKWSALAVLLVFAGLEVFVCVRK